MIFTNNFCDPVFVKTGSSSKIRIEELKNVLNKVNNDGKKLIENEIKTIEYGIYGEEKIEYELKNSYMPMYILHDLCLEYDGLNAQIDYLIITKKLVFVLECKNMIGNIEINNNGDFIRKTNYNGKYQKEGIYSPITQNMRHMELIKKILLSNKNNLINQNYLESNFYNLYKSLVVLANPKTILDAKFAKKEIKDQVIKVDQLINKIKISNDNANFSGYSNIEMKNLADFFMRFHVNKNIDLINKYKNYIIDNGDEEQLIKGKINIISNVNQRQKLSQWNNKNNLITFKNNENEEAITDDVEIIDICDFDTETEKIMKSLRYYRFNRSKKDKIKPYFIFNNLQMEEIINKKPQNIEQLLEISGFGEIKCQKYGLEIINILDKYR